MMADRKIHPQHPLAGGGVYLLDDHEVVRRGLRHLLESDGLSIAGESGSARGAVRRIPALRPALVILDDDLPDGSGAEVCRAIAAVAPTIRCLLITGDAEEAVLIEAILAGAWGCLSKQDGSSEQLRLIRRALAGHTAYSGRFQAALLAPHAPPGPPPVDERLLSLTRQEMNTAIGLGKGLSNRQISQEMTLSEKTVKNLTSTVLRKLGMARRTQAAVILPAWISEPVRVQSVDAGRRVLEDLVGGEIETVTRGDWDVYLNADGVIANLPPNLRAAELMRDCGLDLADAARGTAVFLGHGSHGEAADVPGHLIRRAEDLYGGRLVA